MIEDEYGFYLFSPEPFEPFHSDIKINVKKIIGYGFNNEEFVAIIEDRAGEKIYIICSQNPDTTSKQTIKFEVAKEGYLKNSGECSWVNIENNSIGKFIPIQTYSILSLLFLFPILIYIIIKIKEQTR